MINTIFPAGHKGYQDVAKPDSDPKLAYIKGYSCPYCKKQFNGYKVFQSKLYESKPMRYDLRKFYRDFRQEWYDVIICPHCYFSTFYTYYADPKSVMKPKIETELKDAQSMIALNFEAERNIDFVFASHYLALICAPGYLSTHKQLSAKLWGNLSWLYEDVEDEEMTRLAASNAADAYAKVYTEERLNPVQEQAVCMSAAGMLYRAGRGDEADLKKFLYNVKTIKMGQKAYAELAEDLMEMLTQPGL